MKNHEWAANCCRNTCAIWVAWGGVLVSVFMLAACASLPSRQERVYPDAHEIGVDRATRLAARALQEMGFLVFNQNEAAGYVHGHKIEKDPMGFAVTFNLEVNFVRDAGGALRMAAVCTAGKEVALSTYQGEAVAQFVQTFDRMIQTEASRPRAPAAPRTPLGPAQKKEYEL